MNILEKISILIIIIFDLLFAYTVMVYTKYNIMSYDDKSLCKEINDLSIYTKIFNIYLILNVIVVTIFVIFVMIQSIRYYKKYKGE